MVPIPSRLRAHVTEKPTELFIALFVEGEAPCAAAGTGGQGGLG